MIFGNKIKILIGEKMKTISNKWKLILYGCSGLGVNMLNMIVGTYLCSALLVGGFVDNVANWTYLGKDLVIAALWGTLILVTKAIDGIIDIPLSSVTDNLRTRWGRRRPAIAIGFIPMITAYVLFLFPLSSERGLANTLWFAGMLAVFYAAYTLTMLTYYATFAEIVDNDKDRVFLSNVKSICDVVYFSLSFALVPVFVGMGMNIRIVALIFMPLALTMLIPFFLIKEPSNRKADLAKLEDNELPKDAKGVNFVEALKTSFSNKSFLYWLFVISVMNMGLQLFLSGINEFFSSSGLNMTFVMASSFAPVPFTLQLYNKFVKKFGIKFGLQYILVTFSCAMVGMFICAELFTGTSLLIGAIVCAVIASFAIGAFFSVAYTIPSQLAASENERTGICVSSMYFAVQGLFEGIAAGIASGVILVFLKQSGFVPYMTLIIAALCMLAFVLAIFLPKSIALMGKENK